MDLHMTIETKERLRRKIREELEAQAPAERQKRSRRIEEKLFGLDDFKKAATVCFYVSKPAEVDTTSMIDRALETGKKVLVPLSHLENKELRLYEIKNRREDLKPGAFQIPEPRPDRTRLADPKELDCVIVPGVVFDRKNHRIGYGKGFYDRFLSGLEPRVSKIGLAFTFQVVPEISEEDHDEQLDLVLTD